MRYLAVETFNMSASSWPDPLVPVLLLAPARMPAAALVASESAAVELRWSLSEGCRSDDRSMFTAVVLG